MELAVPSGRLGGGGAPLANAPLPAARLGRARPGAAARQTPQTPPGRPSPGDGAAVPAPRAPCRGLPVLPVPAQRPASPASRRRRSPTPAAKRSNARAHSSGRHVRAPSNGSRPPPPLRLGPTGWGEAGRRRGENARHDPGGCHSNQERGGVPACIAFSWVESPGPNRK